MFFYKSNQEGSSLMEVLAVMSVISLLSISAFKIVSNAYGVFKMTMATSEIKDLQKAISGIYNYSGNYDFDDDVYKTLCETDKVVPNQMCIKKGTSYILRHRLSGDVEITPSSDSKSYLIKFKGLTNKNCVGLTQISWLDRKKINIYRIDVNDVAIAYFPKRADKGFPITSATSFTACKEKVNSITWYFY